jgi:antitoxin component of MazEF toxin-antitoxin module
MLKKLIKYGNSNALVLDKALLEILNIKEGGIVKISTNGKSLIISPSENDTNPTLYWDAQSAFMTAVQQNHEKHLKTFDIKNPDHAERFKKGMPLFSDLFVRYPDIHQKLHQLQQNEDYNNALADLAQKYDPLKENTLYLQEMVKLQDQFSPEIKQFHEEMRAIGQKIEQESSSDLAKENA